MKQLLILLTVISSLISCKNKNILPDDGGKIVVNSLFSIDSVVGLQITKSIYILDSTDFPYVSSLKVKLYQNKTYIEDISALPEPIIRQNFYCMDTKINYRSNNFIPQVGNEYSIQIEQEGADVIIAKTKIPYPVQINSIDTVQTIDENMEQNPDLTDIKYLCRISFTDPLSEENYYMLRVVKYYNEYLPPFFTEIIARQGFMSLKSDDPVVEEEIACGTFKYALLFSDLQFNGKEYTLSFLLDGNDLRRYKSNTPENVPSEELAFNLKFMLYTLTKDYYLYMKSAAIYHRTANDPLFEPVNIHSNIQGGLGIFAGASYSSDTLSFAPIILNLYR